MKLGLLFFASLTMLASYAAALQFIQSQQREKALAAALAQVSDLSARNQALEKQVASLQPPAAAPPDTSSAAVSAPVSAPVAAPNPELARLQGELAAAKAVLAQLNQKWAALGGTARNESVAQDKYALAALQTQLAEENQDAKSQNSAFRGALGGEAQDQRAQITQLNERIAQANDLHKGLAAQISRLKAQRPQDKPQIASLQVQDSANRQAIEEMKTQKANLTAALSAAKAQLADAKNVTPPVNAADLREQIGVLRGRIQEKEAAGRSGDQAAQALRAQIESQKTKISTLEESIRGVQ